MLPSKLKSHDYVMNTLHRNEFNTSMNYVEHYGDELNASFNFVLHI